MNIFENGFLNEFLAAQRNLQIALAAGRPAMLEIDVGISGVSSSHVHDFWRPLGMREAQVDGHYSVQCYLDALSGAYRGWKQQAIARELVHDRVSRLREIIHLMLVGRFGVGADQDKFLDTDAIESAGDRLGRRDRRATAGPLDDVHDSGYPPVVDPPRRHPGFLAELRDILPDDGVTADPLLRLRHGHGHTLEEMYAIKHGKLDRVPGVG